MAERPVGGGLQSAETEPIGAGSRSSSSLNAVHLPLNRSVLTSHEVKTVRLRHRSYYRVLNKPHLAQLGCHNSILAGKQGQILYSFLPTRNSWHVFFLSLKTFLCSWS